MIRFGQSTNAGDATVHVGEDFEIALEENRTTGFRWVTENRGEPFCALIRETTVSPAGPPGAAGMHYWHFRAAGVGVGTIEMHYRRAWESEVGPGLVYQLHVRITQSQPCGVPSEGGTTA